MPAFSTDTAFPMALLDLASRRPWAAVKPTPDALVWRSGREEATTCWRGLLQACLEEAGLRLEELRGTAYCEGPGSMLGVRIACMALRVWTAAGILPPERVYAYSSLALARHGVFRSGERTAGRPFATVCDARRNAWHVLRDDADAIETLPNAALAQLEGDRYVCEPFGRWTKPAAPLTPFPYEPEAAFAAPAGLSLLRPVATPAPLDLRPAAYQKWRPAVGPPAPPSP